MRLDRELFADFCRFATLQLWSGDIDPMYPVLRVLNRSVEPDVRVWRTLLYSVFYDIGTAKRLWELYPEPVFLGRVWAPFTRKPFRTGVERRGFRGWEGNTKAFRLLESVLRQASQGLHDWATGLLAGEVGELGWMHTRAGFERYPGNGPWASYKWADLMKHVLGFEITANDLGVGGGGETAGPIPGMMRLTERDWRECGYDVLLQQALYQEALDAGVPFQGLDQLETALCDFNSLCKGTYYVGHDIDLQLEQSGEVGLGSARAASFPARFLGELQGWRGVRKERKRVYFETRRLVV